MKLQHISEEKCPHCDARACLEQQTGQHVNGQWFETRAFACGMEIDHIPNFSRNEVRVPCPNSKDEFKKRCDRETAKRTLIDLVETLECDSNFRDRLREELGRVRTDTP